MKRSKQCPKCQSVKIGYLPQQPDADEVIVQPKDPKLDPFLPALSRSEGAKVGARALGVSTETVATGWMSYGKVTPFVGRLEAYVCTACGYHETYVASPSAIAWDKIHGFAWVNAVDPAQGPYR